ncbi:MAG: hypothetical protein R2874_03535 [Desulfobacterales bacterium]
MINDINQQHTGKNNTKKAPQTKKEDGMAKKLNNRMLKTYVQATESGERKTGGSPHL